MILDFEFSTLSDTKFAKASHNHQCCAFTFVKNIIIVHKYVTKNTCIPFYLTSIGALNCSNSS